jgi:protein MAK11
MAKRKRIAAEESQSQEPAPKKKTTPAKSKGSSIPAVKTSNTIQIITGSYDRVLHGFTATLSSKAPEKNGSAPVLFRDTFLFNAHTSAIRCLAISPPSTSEDAKQTQKLILASGGTDERINLYHISASVPPEDDNAVPLPSISGTSKLENPNNRELGALLHHSSSINALYFASRSKLLSGAEDNTIAVSRTRDWTVLSTIKAPIPKATGRPSGDTAPPGGTPAGINDFAVHPSMKLMISVGRGEKCMRLWNLVTGRKAGVLSFDRDLLQSVGESKHSTGEGRKVRWNKAGDEYALAFERGVVVFGMVHSPKKAFIDSD